MNKLVIFQWILVLVQIIAVICWIKDFNNDVAFFIAVTMVIPVTLISAYNLLNLLETKNN